MLNLLPLVMVMNSVPKNGVMETYRKLPTLISASEDTSCAATIQQLRSEEMGLRAAENIPLTEEELDGIVDSIKNICPRTHPISFTKLRTLLQEVSHLSHKEWDRTEKNAERLGKILLGSATEDMKGVMSSPPIRQMFERILREGTHIFEFFEVKRRIEKIICFICKKNFTIICYFFIMIRYYEHDLHIPLSISAYSHFPIIFLS